MKKTLIALAVLTVSSASFAQSTVTISGRMDATLRHTAKVAPGAANLAVTEDGGANRINFSVAEDLGGGMKAVADLGMRFQIADGIPQGSGARPLFQGESRVGVSGGFGLLKFGRGLTALQAPNGGYADPWGVRTSAGSAYAVGYATDYAAGGEGRIDGGIFYTSPNFNGFTFSASMSPKKNVSTAATAAAAVPAQANLNTGVVTAAVPAVVARAGGSSKTMQSLNLLYAAGPVVLGVGAENNRGNDKISQIYGTYDLGVAKLHASSATIKGGTQADRERGLGALTANLATSANVVGATTGPVAVNGKINNWTVGVTVPMGAVTILAGYSGWNGNGAVGQKDDTKTGLGLKYDLSKRTFLQTSYAVQTRKNNNATPADPSKDNTNQTSFDMGVVHSF